MKKAFSMVELIFIIVLMGVLAKIGSSYMPDNRLLNDTNFVSMKIKEAQKNAIGYDDFNFSNPKVWDINRSDYILTCITCNTLFFVNLDNNASFNSTVDSSSLSIDRKFCFDNLGRPYIKDQLLLKNVDINISYNNSLKTISVLPMSGYVIIK